MNSSRQEILMEVWQAWCEAQTAEMFDAWLHKEMHTKQKLFKHGVSGKRPDFDAMIKALEQMPDDKLDKIIQQVEAACASGAVDTGAEAGVCNYCKGSGYDPYPNHDTTMRPCPECEALSGGQP